MTVHQQRISADRGHIYWLASYPKSGNTWLRILLANYFEAGSAPISINGLNTSAVASSRRLFDDYSGVASSNLTDEEIARLRPAAFEALSDELAGKNQPSFVKIHDALTAQDRARPVVSPRATAGVIYLIRNPLDVAVSFAHHENTDTATIVDRMGQRDFSLVPQRQGLFPQLRQLLGTWSEHVTSWVGQNDLPLHVVRYEDLHADPSAEFAEALRFVGQSPEQVRVHQAVRAASFDTVSSQEQAAGFVERPQHAASFFRAGRPDTWRGVLADELVRELVSEHGDVMERFGYELP